MVIDQDAPVDGRRARRDRNRAAVIDALFSLFAEGDTAPSSDAIAERAGVSVSSLFRYFESLDDLQEQTIETHFARFGHLFTIPDIGQGSRADRIERLVEARAKLYGSIAPIARLARARELDQPRIAEKLTETRAGFASALRVHFAPELNALTSAQANDIADLIDALTSFEAWDLLRSAHGRSDRAIRRAWVTGIHSLLPGTD